MSKLRNVREKGDPDRRAVRFERAIIAVLEVAVDVAKKHRLRRRDTYVAKKRRWPGFPQRKSQASG
jgi:hypothetical protein